MMKYSTTRLKPISSVPTEEREKNWIGLANTTQSLNDMEILNIIKTCYEKGKPILIMANGDPAKNIDSTDLLYLYITRDNYSIHYPILLKDLFCRNPYILGGKNKHQDGAMLLKRITDEALSTYDVVFCNSLELLLRRMNDVLNENYKTIIEHFKHSIKKLQKQEHDSKQLNINKFINSGTLNDLHDNTFKTI